MDIPLIEDQPRLSKGVLQGAGALTQGVAMEWQWGRPAGLIITTVAVPGGFLLRHAAEEVKVLTRPKWLVCPACLRQCRYLLFYKRWCCRRCSGCQPRVWRFRGVPFLRRQTIVRQMLNAPPSSLRAFELRRRLHKVNREIRKAMERRYGKV
jgi:hypothetical protein